MKTLEIATDWGKLNDGNFTETKDEISVGDALVHSIRNKGRVDPSYIGSLCKKTVKDVVNALHGAIFQNPKRMNDSENEGWELSSQYLSGNIIQKIKDIEDIPDYKDKYPHFEENLSALKAVLPKGCVPEEIYVTLSSPCIPEYMVSDFIREKVLKSNNRYRIPAFALIHDPYTASWQIKGKRELSYFAAVNSEYGTRRMGALDIIEKTLNQEELIVYDDVPFYSGVGPKKIINHIETVQVLDKQQKLIKEFQQWVWADDDRKKRLISLYNEKFGSIVICHYDGSFLDFQGLNDKYRPHDYQKNAVARIILSKNVLLAHDVGAGKTLIMIASAMELRRMGLCKKPLFVVPNAIVSQWEQMFLDMYPDAKLLTITASDFTKAKRKQVLDTIKNGDFDGIIIASSSFDLISVSPELQMQRLRDRLEILKNISSNTPWRETSVVKWKTTALTKRLSKMAVAEADDRETYFEKLGIDRIYVDESHNYKNLPLETRMGNVKGINAAGSKKCVSMLEKVRYIQSVNNGGGVVFATGTPLTNSIADAYTTQYYLQFDELEMLDLSSFDAWASMFAEKVTDFEVDVDTSQYRTTTRLSQYHNLPELAALFAQVADVYYPGNKEGTPELNVRDDVLVPKSPELAAYIDILSERAELVRGHYVGKTEDNMLKITIDGRKAALDMRLIDEETYVTADNKIKVCGDKVYEIYKKTMDNQSTQVVFSDIGTPKDGFNVYDELRNYLIDKGIPKNEIAYSHDATTDLQKRELYKKVQTGAVRVIIGSTQKIGTGVNIQNKLIAMHHLSVPWRPSDLIQREGRMIRPGNENDTVEIYRYITAGSFDAYSWQLIETKQKFITAFLSGYIEQRSASDLEDTTLSYAEVKALSIENPLIKERFEVANELKKFTILKRKDKENREILIAETYEIRNSIAKHNENIENHEIDYDTYEFCKKEYTLAEKMEFGNLIKNSIKQYMFKDSDTMITSYQGFDVIVPAYRELGNASIILRGYSTYNVELGDSVIGNVTRINNCLEGIKDIIKSIIEARDKLQVRLDGINAELGQNNLSYDLKIIQLKDRLRAIDLQLGVSA